MSFVCSTCNDTHRMHMEDVGDVTCTFCPVPCQRCRAGGNGPYCVSTPCACACHGARAPVTPPTDAAPALRAKNAQLVHVLKQLREVIQPSVPALIRSYIARTPDIDVEWAHGVRDRVEKLGREIDDALIAFADDVAVKERAELVQRAEKAEADASSLRAYLDHLTLIAETFGDMDEEDAISVGWWDESSLHGFNARVRYTVAYYKAARQALSVGSGRALVAELSEVKTAAEQLADALVDTEQKLGEARAAAEVQADALAEQAADMERLRRRLDIEFEKTKAMNRALGEVWKQVPDEDRIGKPADQWVRGLGRRVRELTAAPLGRGCDCGTPSTLHDVACPSAEDERTV